MQVRNPKSGCLETDLEDYNTVILSWVLWGELLYWFVLHIHCMIVSLFYSGSPVWFCLYFYFLEAILESPLYHAHKVHHLESHYMLHFKCQCSEWLGCCCVWMKCTQVFLVKATNSQPVSLNVEYCSGELSKSVCEHVLISGKQSLV